MTISFIFGDIKMLPPDILENLKEKNSIRFKCGLEPIVIKIKTCAVCGTRFESLGNKTCGCIWRGE